MVLELMEQRQAKLVEGSYQNIKITTPEDLLIAECFCQTFPEGIREKSYLLRNDPWREEPVKNPEKTDFRKK